MGVGAADSMTYRGPVLLPADRINAERCCHISRGLLELDGLARAQTLG